MNWRDRAAQVLGNRADGRTDKTDKSPQAPLLSVLSVPPPGIISSTDPEAGRPEQAEAQPAQQRNTALLHVAPPRECNTQQQVLGDAAELRRLIVLIAKSAPGYWTAHDVEEAVAVGLTDLDSAITTFRAIAQGYGAEVHQ